MKNSVRTYSKRYRRILISTMLIGLGMLVCSSFIAQARGGRGGGGSRGGGRRGGGSRHSGGSSGHGSVRHSGSTHQKEKAQPAPRTTVGERERAGNHDRVEQPNRDRSDVRKEEVRDNRNDHREDIRRNGEEVRVGGRRYYYWGGGYYQYDDGDDDYEEVDPPIGAIVSSIPSGTLGMTIDGQKYYVHNDVYYTPIYQSGVAKYKVVKNPN